MLALLLADYDQSERFLTAAVTRARDAGDRYYAAFALNGLGSVALHRGYYAREGLALMREIGDTDDIAALLDNLGYGAFMQGDYAEATARSEASRALYRQLESDHGTASMLCNLGRAVLAQGESERARILLQEGLRLGQQIGNLWYIAVCLEGLATTAAVQGRYALAMQLFGAVATLAESAHVALPSSDQAINERYLALARASLAQSTTTAAWQTGRAWTADEAIAAALSGAE